MTYQIITIGCQMNQADSERLASFLESQGLRETTTRPDIFIVNTCGIRQSAENRISGLTGKMRKNNPKTKIVLTGCLSYRKDLQKRFAKQIDLFIDIADMMQLLDRLGLPVKRGISGSYLEIDPNYQSSFRAYVPIGNGCNNFCSYCVVPYARGRETWRSAKNILTEVKGLLAKGYKEIILVAQNVNSYQDDDYSFPQLLETVSQMPGKFWLRFFSSHPKDLSPELIKVIGRNEKICPHLHLAAQSGDDKILQAMNRKYTAKKFLSLVKAVSKARPGISITTDVIVGYPGETKAQFNNTVKLFKAADFDQAFISRYSPRPGTVSAQLKDNVSPAEKQRREEELNSLLGDMILKNNEKYLNKEIEVLLDKKTTKGYFGQSEAGKTVKVNVAKTKVSLGNFYKVKINLARNFGLEGDLVKEKPKAIAILGTTSAGKTAWGVKLAKKFKGEIISADSRQVYTGLDIGSGKDLAEYGNVPYHLIDVVSPKLDFDLAKYQRLANKALADVLKRKKLPLLVGGSGLYLEAVVSSYNLVKDQVDKKVREELESKTLLELQTLCKKLKPDFFAKLNNSDRNNHRRLVRYIEIIKSGKVKEVQVSESPYNWLVIGISKEPDEVKRRIKKRLKERLEKENMIAEVEGLLESGVSEKKLLAFGLEYRFITMYLRGDLEYDEMFDKLYQTICKFAKRQMTWFRRLEKSGTEIIWLKDLAEAEKVVRDFLKD